MFFINSLSVLTALIVLHLVFLFFLKNEKKNLKFLWKIRYFVLLIFLFSVFSGTRDIPLIQLKKWTLSVSYQGCMEGLVMVAKIIAMLMVTQVVRWSMKAHEFMEGLTKVGLSESSANIVNEIIQITLEGKKGSGKGRNKSLKEKGKKESSVNAAEVLLKGKIGKLPQKVMSKIDEARAVFEGNPHSILASAALSITLIRMVKIAPGLPIAPGHKNVLIIPVFIYAISKTKKPFAGLQIGLISGLIHFLMGFGKYGPLSIFQFALLGLVLDLLLKLPIKRRGLLFYMVLGGIAGLIRFSTELLLVYILGLSNVIYLLYLPMILAQVSFGIASGFVSKEILKKSTS